MSHWDTRWVNQYQWLVWPKKKKGYWVDPMGPQWIGSTKKLYLKTPMLLGGLDPIGPHWIESTKKLCLQTPRLLGGQTWQSLLRTRWQQEPPTEQLTQKRFETQSLFHCQSVSFVFDALAPLTTTVEHPKKGEMTIQKPILQMSSLTLLAPILFSGVFSFGLWNSLHHSRPKTHVLFLCSNTRLRCLKSKSLLSLPSHLTLEVRIGPNMLRKLHPTTPCCYIAIFSVYCVDIGIAIILILVFP